MDNLRTAEEAGVLKEYRVLDGSVLPVTGGLWYRESQKVPASGEDKQEESMGRSAGGGGLQPVYRWATSLEGVSAARIPDYAG
jgi:hypothetical protein